MRGALPARGDDDAPMFPVSAIQGLDSVNLDRHPARLIAAMASPRPGMVASSLSKFTERNFVVLRCLAANPILFT